MGFDNVQELDLMNPPLSSVAAPMYTMGRTAVTNLLAMIRGAAHTAAKPVLVPTSLVVRTSSDLPFVEP